MGLADNFSNYTKSPVAFTAEYKGKIDKWSIYKMEDKERKEVDSFPFIILDESYSCMRGFNRKEGKGIYSNMVSNTKNQEMRVKINGGDEIARGFYKEIKEKVESKGGRYNKILFVYVEGIGIGKVFLAGGSLTGYFDLKKEVDLSEVPVIEQESFREEQSNFGPYKVPIFKYGEPSKKMRKAADDAYEELMEYLDGKPSGEDDQVDDGGSELGQYILAAEDADADTLEKNWRLIARKIEDHDDADTVMKEWQKRAKELGLDLNLSLDPDAEYQEEALPF